MTLTIRLLIAVSLLSGIFAIAQDKKPPEKLQFASIMGTVTFDHAAHVMRAKGDCATCHTKLFPEDSKAPLNFKAGMHKTAEGAKTSCGACHTPGGAAFDSKGNCAKCHVK